jgi:hypothetical protein
VMLTLMLALGVMLALMLATLLMLALGNCVIGHTGDTLVCIGDCVIGDDVFGNGVMMHATLGVVGLGFVGDCVVFDDVILANFQHSLCTMQNENMSSC